MRCCLILAAAALLLGGCSSESTTLNPDVKPEATVVVDISPAMR